MPFPMKHRYCLVDCVLCLGCGSSEKSNGPAMSAGTGGVVASAGGAVSTGRGGSDSASGGAAKTSGGSSGSMAGAGANSSAKGGSGGVSGSSAGGSSAGGSSAGGSSAGSDSCGSDTPGASFEEDCLACAVGACERCLCTDCTEQLQNCGSTSGCPEIAECIRESQCTGADCYCGTFDAISCAAGQSNGPCKPTILNAPGSMVPTLLNPSAGPASDAAVAISECMRPGQSCAAACPAEP
jgi:hypothetical protein